MCASEAPIDAPPGVGRNIAIAVAVSVTAVVAIVIVILLLLGTPATPPGGG
ncbi:MAG: hypothetical protein JW839_02705 [Candidatus Lokiarchaeota archaeon]|nr:hypothetical protein [Candidatus Lokiarchaeota archaeon]